MIAIVERHLQDAGVPFTKNIAETPAGTITTYHINHKGGRTATITIGDPADTIKVTRTATVTESFKNITPAQAGMIRTIVNTATVN